MLFRKHEKLFTQLSCFFPFSSFCLLNSWFETLPPYFVDTALLFTTSSLSLRLITGPLSVSVFPTFTPNSSCISTTSWSGNFAPFFSALFDRACSVLFVCFVCFFFPLAFFIIISNSLETSCQMSHRFYLFVSTLIWHADCSRSGVTVLVLFIKGLLDAWVHFCWLATTADLIWAAHLI